MKTYTLFGHIPKDKRGELLSTIHYVLKDGGILFSDLREGEGEILEEKRIMEKLFNDLGFNGKKRSLSSI